MRSVSIWSGAVFAAVAIAGLVLSSCSQSDAPHGATSTDHAPPAGDPHDHSGWWCETHGVPEEMCALCDPKLAAAYQQKGDWCEDHNRPASQCFVCRPELQENFAAQYEAKFGKRPLVPGT